MKESKRKSENYKSGKIDKKLSVSGINTTGGLKPEKSKVQCKLCKKFFVSLPTHLNRSKCKDENTQGYNKLKSEQENYQKNYWNTNKEVLKEKRAIQRSETLESISQANSQYYSKNKEKISSKRKSIYSENKEEMGVIKIPDVGSRGFSWVPVYFD